MDPQAQGNPFTGSAGGSMPDIFSMFGQQNSGQHQQFSFNFGNRDQGKVNIDLSDLLRQMMGDGGGGRQARYHHQQPKTYHRDVTCTLEELATGATKKLKVKLPFNGRSMEKIFTVHLKPGWKAGTKIKFPPTTSFPAGITFVVKEKKHATLKRVGDDLIFRHKLVKKKKNDTSSSPVTITVHLPYGETWSRKIAGKSSLLRKGQKLTVPDKGMPIKGGPFRGNLIVEFYE